MGSGERMERTSFLRGCDAMNIEDAEGYFARENRVQASPQQSRSMEAAARRALPPHTPQAHGQCA
eukprot:scaffold108969_cov41-Tisochrysis_lutea.AAC.1